MDINPGKINTQMWFFTIFWFIIISRYFSEGSAFETAQLQTGRFIAPSQYRQRKGAYFRTGPGAFAKIR